MTHPTPPSARQVAIAMLQAAEEGKTVQLNQGSGWMDADPSAWLVEHFGRWQWRIKPTTEPVKAMREVFIADHDWKNSNGDDRVGHAYLTPGNIGDYPKYREVSPAHDAEIAELIEAASDVNEWLCRTDREGTAHQRHLANALAAVRSQEKQM